jgi:hypothetical protein
MVEEFGNSVFPESLFLEQERRECHVVDHCRPFDAAVGSWNGVVVHHRRVYSHLLLLALISVAIQLIGGRRVV